MSSRSQEELMTLASWMYYDDRLSHREIAAKLGVSRVAVTRLLKRAREEGVVEIKITQPLPLPHSLGRRLQESFHLQNALVVKAGDSSDATMDAVGAAGAQYLLRVVFPGCRLGVGWSMTVSRMAPHLKTLRSPVSCTVNELAGSFLGQYSLYNISHRVAEALGASIETLPVPAVVQSQVARDAILDEEAIGMTLQHAAQCDIAFVGLGHVSAEGTMVRTGYLTPRQMVDLRRQGAVGEILMHYYDSSGQLVANPLESRIISLAWPAFRRIPHVVLLACGQSKVEGILGALRGRLCHCVITDTDTAQQILESAEPRSTPAAHASADGSTGGT